MNINSLNNVQNFSALKNNKTDNTTANTNFKAQETVECPLQTVNAQMALANYTIPKVNLAFKGKIQDDVMSDEEFEKLKKYLKSILEKEDTNISLTEKQLKLFNNKFLRQMGLNEIYSKLQNRKNKDYFHFTFTDKQLNDKTVIEFCKLAYSRVDSEHIDQFIEICENEKLGNNKDAIPNLLIMAKNAKTEEQKWFLETILSDENLLNSQTFINNAKDIIYNLNNFEQVCIVKKIISNKKLYDSEFVMKNIGNILYSFDEQRFNRPKIANEYGLQIINKILDNPQLYENENIMNNLDDILEHVRYEEQLNVVNTITDKRHFYDNENLIKNLGKILESLKEISLNENNKYQWQISQVRLKVLNKILNNKKYLDCKQFWEYVPYIINNSLESEHVFELCQNKQLLPYIKHIIENKYTDEQINQILELSKKELEPNQVILLIDNPKEISYKDLIKLNKTIGKEKAGKLSESDTKPAIKFVDTYKKENINEISREGKKKLLKVLVASDKGLFNISDEMKEMFPIIPTNEEDFCKLLPSVVRSLGFDTNVILDKHFDEKLNHLGETLSKISDEDFKNLDIKQEYSKDDFINDVLDKVKDLPKEERQKVYDYFGFELHHNKKASTGYSITGYPMNLNNGEKLAQIENEDTKTVIKDLRSNVEKFTKDNKITCENKELEQNINNIIKVLPELRATIGCKQHGSHAYDVFTHSLKVMQGIVKNPDYQNLNESDKKIMLLSSLLHDIAKKEGITDRKHADNSSFDSSFIIKKFNLPQEDEIKLYTLIKNHEWLNYVNTAKSEEQQTKRRQSIAYDLRHDNLFDMSLMFTHADLKGVNDEFADNKNEKRISKVDGVTRSYSEAADFHAEKIKEYIEELKPTQPLLPVTPIPKASDIEQAITTVNEDGSTNIKGVYKDKDGLIVIKYNELQNEDLEKIGFPKGSTVNGTEAKTSAGDDVDTGNIKFFAHGLDYPNQVAKFDAFNLIDSDALLSVSYAERPESKYRFFRPQGILLDVDTKYIHGGGETDSGSGTGKFIKEFKNNYIFGGNREGDRKYVSDLIKNTLNLDDEGYKEFVDKYKNASLSEIEPKEDREKLIKAFSEINSNTRRGNREYNEMYISNPKPPMAVFAYAEDYNEKIDNPIEFLNRTEIQDHESRPVKKRTEFLRAYALEHNVPFIVFGN